jgi:hypothetical protein
MCKVLTVVMQMCQKFIISLKSTIFYLHFINEYAKYSAIYQARQIFTFDLGSSYLNKIFFIFYITFYCCVLLLANTSIIIFIFLCLFLFSVKLKFIQTVRTLLKFISITKSNYKCVLLIVCIHGLLNSIHNLDLLVDHYTSFCTCQVIVVKFQLISPFIRKDN